MVQLLFGLFGRRSGFDFKTVHLKNGAECQQNRQFVVNQQNASFHGELQANHVRVKNAASEMQVSQAELLSLALASS
jgi:hypothetical protein